MKIGVVKEIKNEEYRVSLTPDGVRSLIADGHNIAVQEDAGLGSGFSNEQYLAAGADIVDVATAWKADLIMKIKEPQETEFSYLHNNILFTYLHLSGVPIALTEALIAAKTTAIAYETVEQLTGGFPLLAPMSAVAGNMATTIGSYYLARFNQGKGTQLGKVFDESHGKVMILGNGIVGQHAARVATALGTEVYLFGLNQNKPGMEKLLALDNLHFVHSSDQTITEHIINTDLLIGAVYQIGSRAPHLVSESLVSTMEAGSVIVDVAIDQGGCIETSHATTHSDPVYRTHDVIHYCVSNMPGAYPRTSTISLTNATLPYIRSLANNGIEIMQQDKYFASGLNTYKGYITCKPVAESLGLLTQYKAFSEL